MTKLNLKEMTMDELRGIQLLLSEEVANIKGQLESFIIDKKHLDIEMEADDYIWKSKAEHALSIKRTQQLAVNYEFGRRKEIRRKNNEQCFEEAVKQIVDFETYGKILHKTAELLNAKN